MEENRLTFMDSESISGVEKYTILEMADKHLMRTPGLIIVMYTRTSMPNSDCR